MPDSANVKRAYVVFNGQQYTATYNTDLDLWSVDITAPSESSWGQPDHVFLAEIHAEDMAGNTAVLDSTDPTYGDQLMIRVLEKTAPTATIIYPTTGSVLGESAVDIRLRLHDAGGSGIDASTIDFQINGSKIADAVWTNGDDGEKLCTYHKTGLSDGNNTITLKVTDNDGNTSAEARVEFVVSTAAPSLDITEPIEGLLTNRSPVTVTGTVKPGSAYTQITNVTVNEKEVIIGSSGEFTEDVTLVEGSNEIVIVATDNVGNTTTVRRTVILDSTAPIITDVTVTPTIVDASGTIHVTFKVVDTQ